MKIRNLDTNTTFSLSNCKNNHVPARFIGGAHKRIIKVDGQAATLVMNPDIASYIVIQAACGRNFYFYGYTHAGSTNFATV